MYSDSNFQTQNFGRLVTLIESWISKAEVDLKSIMLESESLSFLQNRKPNPESKNEVWIDLKLTLEYPKFTTFSSWVSLSHRDERV